MTIIGKLLHLTLATSENAKSKGYNCARQTAYRYVDGESAVGEYVYEIATSLELSNWDSCGR